MPSLYAVMSEEKSRQSERIRKLQEENEQLKKEVKRYGLMVNANSDLNEEIYEQLKKTENNYKSLLKENDELKKENKMLKTTIARNEEYINRITHKGKWRD